MEEDKKLVGNEQPEERTFTQSEVNAIINQYKIKFDSIVKQASEELEKRDLSNFYQILSVLFEVVKNRDAYTDDFVKKCVDHIELGVSKLFEQPEKKEDE